MKRMLSASFFPAIIALLCIMDAGVPIYGYQVILDPIKFTEMEMAAEHAHMQIRKTNKRLVDPAEVSGLPYNQHYNVWANSRQRRNPSPLANPFAFAYPNAFAEPGPGPAPLLKRFGHLSSPKGYTFDEGAEEDVPNSQEFSHL